MTPIVAASRYLALAGVACAIVASTAAFAWSLIKTAIVIGALARGDIDGMAVRLVEVMDGVLLGAGLLLVALGLHELFVGGLDLPERLASHDAHALEAKVAGIVVVVMAVAFLGQVEAGKDGPTLLATGAGVALVSATLAWATRK